MSDNKDYLIDTYGRSAPDAAKFGVGAATLDGIKRATDARREQKPETDGMKR
jgi:hypothetical protein